MTRFILLLALAVCAVGASARADTVLITGANRGMGLEFAKQYAAKGYTVIATTRNPADAEELKALAAKNKKLVIEKLDVNDAENIKALAAKYRGKPVDILLNNAGILGDIPKQSVGTFDGSEFAKIMQTNVLGAMLMTEAFRDNIVASTQKKVVAISSHAGMVSSGGAGFPFYSTSKAALARGLRGMGAEIGNGVLVGIVFPGAVQTEMLAATPMKGKGLTVEDAVGRMIAAVDGLNPETAKKPLTINGKPAEW